MKKMGCLVSLLLIAAICAGLFFSGIVTTDLLMHWSENALVWSIDGLNGLLDKVQAYNRAVTEGKASILLVNASHPLPEDYKAENLVNLYEQKRHFRLAKSDLYLTQETFDAMNAMFAAAEKEGLNGFIVTSAYRSREDQARIYAESAAGYAQKPGQSEHETGLAFDVTARYDSGDFGDRGDHALVGIDHDVQNSLDGLTVGGHSNVHLNVLAAGDLVGQTTIDADTLAKTLGENFAALGLHELILQRGAAGIDHQNFHVDSFSLPVIVLLFFVSSL
jgi:LAS superfamily LD-carboxypeptidase LdcB